MFTTQDLKSCVKDLAAIFLILKQKTHNKHFDQFRLRRMFVQFMRKNSGAASKFPHVSLTAENGAYVG